MQPLQKDNIKINIAVLIVCLLISALNLFLKIQVTSSWNNGILTENHELLMNFQYTNNEQSRLLQFLIPETFSRLFGVSIPTAYSIQRVLFMALTFFVFFKFCKKWFNYFGTSACVLLLSLLIIPSTYRNHTQESAALLALTFISSLWAIRERKDIEFAFLLLIGGVNNETSLFLPAVYVFYNFNYYSFPKLIWKTALVSIMAFVAVGTIRYITRDRPHLGGAWNFYENMNHLDSLFKVLHVFWILPFFYFKKLNPFLKRSLMTIPLFIIPHLITGKINEIRQMIPMAFLVIPASWFTIQELVEKYWLRKRNSNNTEGDLKS